MTKQMNRVQSFLADSYYKSVHLFLNPDSLLAYSYYKSVPTRMMPNFVGKDSYDNRFCTKQDDTSLLAVAKKVFLEGFVPLEFVLQLAKKLVRVDLNLP